MKKSERTFYSLCQEIDDLNESVEYWKSLYEAERKINNDRLNENLESAKQGVANALRFALSVSDDENGNLVISKDDRKQLAENWS
jgi:hypothetical protein